MDRVGAVTMMEVSTINQPDKNPNKMTDYMFRSLVEGIKKEGFLQPILLRKADNTIIDGNHRFMAAVEAGMKEVPVLIIDVDRATAVKIGIAMNQKKGYFDYAELRELINAELQEELGNVQAISGLATELGFTDIELQRLTETSMFDNEKELKQKLLEAGVSPDKIEAMADVAKTGTFQELPKTDIIGTQSKIRYPIVFFCETEQDFLCLKEYFKTEDSREPNTALLLSLVRGENV